MSAEGRSEAAAASRRWARRVWFVQLAIVVVSFALLLMTDVGLPIIAGMTVALLGAHVWARRSLGRELAELGRPGAGRPDAGRPDAGRPDAGRPDAGRPDAGRPDAGRPDAG